MNICVLYDSHAGTTKKAAQNISEYLTGKGHRCQILSIDEAKQFEPATFELIIFGAWTMGFMLLGQHPSTKYRTFVDSLKNLEGKNAWVFCTYKIAIGPMLKKMQQQLEAKGAHVTSGFKLRGSALTSASETILNM
jgi:flavodoxin